MASLCWDLRKFYENISHQQLKERAAEHGFPLALVSVAVNAYKMARVVTYDGRAADEVFPSKGIVAGDSLSDVLVKLYYLKELDDFAEANPEVELDVYFDDVQVAARGPKARVRELLTGAAEDLRRAIEEGLQARLALDKASVTSSNKELCEELRRAIGDAAGPPTELATFLGVDNLLGRRRRILKRASRWQARVGAATRRRARLRRLRAGLPKGVVKIYAAGVQAGATYGAEVVGVPVTELRALQPIALASMAPATRGRSKSALCIATGILAGGLLWPHCSDGA